MYIDLDSGTIVNGPLVWVSDDDRNLDGMCDSEVIEYGTDYGYPVRIAPNAF